MARRSQNLAGRRAPSRGAPQPDLFLTLQPRPLSGCVTPSYHAYASMQRAVVTALKRARHHHRKTAAILRWRSGVVHAALRGAS